MHSAVDSARLEKYASELQIYGNLLKPIKWGNVSQLIQLIDQNQSYQESLPTLPIPKPITGTILIAEDAKMNMMLVKALLKNMVPNVRVLTAINGLEVLEVISKEKIDLILMDVQMPELDGISTTIQIREMEMKSGTHIPIVALTAGALQEEKERAIKCGMDDFLTKPIESEKLEEAIFRFLPPESN